MFGGWKHGTTLIIVSKFGARNDLKMKAIVVKKEHLVEMASCSILKEEMAGNLHPEHKKGGKKTLSETQFISTTTPGRSPDGPAP